MINKIKLIYTNSFYKILHFYILNSKNILSEEKENQLILSLKKLIEKTPFWAKGHLEYANLCISSKKVEEAYASVCAIEVLKATEFIDKARLIKAKCYLNFSEIDRAIALLLKLNKGSNNYEILAELSSAYIMKDDKKKASFYLNQIPEEFDLPETAILRDYVKTLTQ